MTHKTRIISILTIKLILVIVVIAFISMPESSSYPELEEPQIEQVREQEEPATVAQMIKSIHFEYLPPISLAKSKSGSDMIKVRIGGPYMKLSFKK